MVILSTNIRSTCAFLTAVRLLAVLLLAVITVESSLACQALNTSTQKRFHAHFLRVTGTVLLELSKMTLFFSHQFPSWTEFRACLTDALINARTFKWR